MTSSVHASLVPWPRGTLAINARYEVQEFIGRGGMQEVFRALDRSFGREVALKRPQASSAKRRFDESARLSARVMHPNVARTLDYSPDENILVEELVVGQELKQLASVYGVFDPALAAHLTHHLALGLAACHEAGVVHRDLKPSNVLVSSELWPSVVKITDFGIARMAQDEIADAAKDEETLTSSSTAIGALPYMAPEMIANARAASFPADVWSLGCMAYEFLSGRRPFGAGLSAVSKITNPHFKPIPLLPRSQDPKFKVLFDELAALIQACITFEPSERPSARDIAQMCGSLCYPEHKRVSGVPTGRVFGSGLRQYSFLKDTFSQGDVFFHLRSYYGSPDAIAPLLAYSAFPGNPKPRAFPVVPLAKLPTT